MGLASARQLWVLKVNTTKFRNYSSLTLVPLVIANVGDPKLSLSVALSLYPAVTLLEGNAFRRFYGSVEVKNMS